MTKPIDRKEGFTLIDLVIALAIAGILAAIAVPVFSDAVRKSRRVDAMNSLIRVHLAQARYRAGNSAYATRLTELGWNSDVADSVDGYYQLRLVSQGDDNAYMAIAVPNPATDQRHDACRRFVLTQDGPDLNNSTASYCWAR